MKCGIIVYHRSKAINIGDDIQFLNIKQLYERIGCWGEPFNRCSGFFKKMEINFNI